MNNETVWINVTLWNTRLIAKDITFIAKSEKYTCIMRMEVSGHVQYNHENLNNHLNSYIFISLEMKFKPLKTQNKLHYIKTI